MLRGATIVQVRNKGVPYGTLPNTEVNNKYKKRHNQENRGKDLTKSRTKVKVIAQKADEKLNL
jgi:hypothetical protein